MIGVDTNVLVRFLTADDPGQHPASVAFFEQRSARDPAFVSAVTLAETAWVLRRVHRLPSAEITESLRLLLDSPDVVVEGDGELDPIRNDVASPSVIADLLIGHLGKAAGCTRTVTFDKKAAKRIPSMELLS